MVTPNTEYLLPEIKHLLYLSEKERIFYIEKDNWIGYTRAKQALSKLKNLYTHPGRQRMPNLLIISPTNNGKSMLIEKFCRDFLPIKKKYMHYSDSWRTEEKELLLEMPILAVQMLPVPDTKRFYRTLFDKLKKENGAPSVANKILYAVPYENDVIEVLQQFKVKMLIIDEIHNVLAGRNDKQHEFLNSLRYLGNALKIPIVCVGTKDAYLAIRSDPQLENRFEPFLLPLWQAGQEYESLLASMESILPLKKRSHLNDPSVANYILETSEGILGEIVTMIRRAAIMAIKSGHETIDEKLLKQVDYRSPSGRTHLFERTISGLI